MSAAFASPAASAHLPAGSMAHLRPAPGYADFRTPIRGLYQCSSATHGGGGVTGIAGYLASRHILADRRRARVGLRQ
jgi:phytoene dehydrogenase-like protein